jgi:hypothetical protein
MTGWLLSIVWYGSVAAAVVSAIAIVRPLRLVGLVRRGRAIATLVIALLAIASNVLIVPEWRITGRRDTTLDRILPRYHFREVHVRSIDASSSRVMAAVKSVTAGEIALFDAFTTLRRVGRKAPESILNAPAAQSILDVATRTGFVMLGDTDREVAVGSFVAAPDHWRSPGRAPDAQEFEQIDEPGIVKAAMNFVVEPRGTAATLLTTETRVFATDLAAARRFAAYWRTIFPGSWILRVTWLRAIERRAER